MGLPSAVNRDVIRPFAALRRALLPVVCLGCERLIDIEPPLLGLCVPCRGRLARCRRRCAGCGRPVPTPSLPDGYLCGRCRRRRPAFDALLPLYLYRQPLRAVVGELKFGGLAYLGRHVAQLMIAHETTALERCDLLVAVPLHWRRRLARGYNQAEEIARPLARRLRKPLVRPLVRLRATAPQASLSRASRRSNVEGAFRLRRRGGARAAIRARHVALIDDVVTTGRTLEAAARELKRGGATAVTALVLARATLDDSR